MCIQYYTIVKKLTVHAPCITSISGLTDPKFESLLHIIETKCVSEFDMLCTFGEENSIGNVCAYSDSLVPRPSRVFR